MTCDESHKKEREMLTCEGWGTYEETNKMIGEQMVANSDARDLSSTEASRQYRFDGFKAHFVGHRMHAGEGIDGERCR